MFKQQEVLGKMFTIYGDAENPLFVVKEVADWIQYSSSNISKIPNMVDDDEKVRNLVTTPGGLQESWFLTEDGLYEVLMQSRKPIAKQFKKKVKEILKTIRKTGHYETPEYKLMIDMQSRMERIESFIDKRCKAQVNPRYIYNYCWNDYARVTGDDSKRGLNGALNDYFGYVPYSKDIRPLPVKDWVCKHIGADDVEEFVNSIEDGLISKSREGHWVNLGGVVCNNHEWSKVLDEFNHKCAYCGISEDETNLMPEHIISQSVLSKEEPGAVDLIGNIVPACGCCNGSKSTHDMETWYRKQPFFSEYRLRKIKAHQNKYQL